jgi:hypothetical protein
VSKWRKRFGLSDWRWHLGCRQRRRYGAFCESNPKQGEETAHFAKRGLDDQEYHQGCRPGKFCEANRLMRFGQLSSVFFIPRVADIEIVGHVSTAVEDRCPTADYDEPYTSVT